MRGRGLPSPGPSAEESGMNRRARIAAPRPYGVLIDVAELVRAMRVRGLTGAAVARKSKEIAERDGRLGVLRRPSRTP